MAALLWMLTSLFQVLPAMTELPPPINLTLTSDHLIHLLRWQQGAATPTGTSYSVSVCPETGTSWLPVPGCQTVQDPLVCNLTEAFSDPHQAYFTQVTAQLEGQTSQSVIHQGFKPIKDTILNPPLLHVTPCGRNLCVDLQPPLPHLRHIYTHLKYTLKITSSEDRVQFSEDSVSLGRRVLERLGPSRRYCVSVCLTDSLELRQSDYSRPVCAFTPSTFSADAVISALLCVLLMFFVFTVALLVYAGFICLKRRPLPSVLQVCVFRSPLPPTSPSPPSTWSTRSASCPAHRAPPTPASLFRPSDSVSISRRMSWRPVASCSELTAGQTCDLTRTFKDPFDYYQARVKAFTSSQTSNWSESRNFQPVTDTVLGPPDVSVSGCGNCLLLQLKFPATEGLLKDLYRKLVIQVKRTRDGAQFVLSMPYTEQTVISYLQRGVEYCVSVSVSALVTSTSISSEPQCVFTSRSPTEHTAVVLVFSLLGVLCALRLLSMGLLGLRAQGSLRRCRLSCTSSSPVCIEGRSPPDVSSQAS
uniref:interleukin-20 receptor subunit alpha-like isoform X1 n=1 Tax=Semicossyphus pulcher TaxID=241346 RepID=UPI0037E8DDD9